MKWEWDVKDAMPYTMKMKTINFMAYMFHNSPYRITMDGPLSGLMRRLIINANKMPPRIDRGARTKKLEIKATLIAQFEKIYKIASKTGAPSYKLRDFYETPFANLDANQKKIIEHFLDFHKPRAPKNVNEFEHFCMPFLAIQYASQNGNDALLVDPADMDTFLSRIGHLTILDLYTISSKLYSKDELDGIRNGYDFGILQFSETQYTKKGTVTLLTPPPGNGMKCVGGECVDGLPSNWCTEDAEGNCTAGG